LTVLDVAKYMTTVSLSLGDRFKVMSTSAAHLKISVPDVVWSEVRE